MKNVIIYDNKDYFDRYTIFINGCVFGMSEKPFSPLGFNQYCGDTDTIQEGDYLGEIINFNDLNNDVKNAIQQRYK